MPHTGLRDNRSGLPPAAWALWVLGLVAAMALIYVRIYGQPLGYDADNLAAEDMFRDLIERNGSWSLWGLPGAAQYVEMAIYFCLRRLTGDFHATMALYPALMLCLLSVSQVYLLWPVLDEPGARVAVLMAAVFLMPAYAFGGTGFMFTHRWGHALVIPAAFFATGLLFGLLQDRVRSFRLVLLLGITVLMSASDSLYILYFCVPACGLILFDAFTKRLDWRASVGLVGAIGLATVAGKVLDNLWRNFPAPLEAFTLGLGKSLGVLAEIAKETVARHGATPLDCVLVLAAVAGLALAVRDVRTRRLALYLLFAGLCNCLFVAATGLFTPRYITLWLAVTGLTGSLFLVTRLAGNLGSRGGIALGLAGVVCSLYLGVAFFQSYRSMLPPYYPPLAQALDELAREKGVKTGYAGFWTARPVNLLSKEGLELSPVEGYGYRFSVETQTRRILRDRVDMVVYSPDEDGSYSGVDRELMLNANGRPDEVVVLPDAGREVHIYKNGVSLPGFLRVLLEGERLTPEFAVGDRVQWRGELHLANGLTLTEVRTVPRLKRHMALFFFKEPVESLLGGTFTLYAAGNKLTRHRRDQAAKISRGADSLTDKLRLLFVPSREWTATIDECGPLPGGGSVTWVRLPNWNSTEWQALFLDDGKKVYRIK